MTGADWRVGYHWIVAVDGKPADICRAEFVVRQGKVRKESSPESDVTLHYGSAESRTYHNGRGLVVEIRADLLPPLARVL